MTINGILRLAAMAAAVSGNAGKAGTTTGRGTAAALRLSSENRGTVLMAAVVAGLAAGNRVPKR
jgi:hypothetical protein